MVLVDAVIAGTHVLPSFGRSILTKELLEQLAEQLLGQQANVLRDHDIDTDRFSGLTTPMGLRSEATHGRDLISRRVTG